MKFEKKERPTKMLRELDIGTTFVVDARTTGIYMLVALGEKYPSVSGVINLTTGRQCGDIGFEGLVIPLSTKIVECEE